jgi:hypothetical protein
MGFAAWLVESMNGTIKSISFTKQDPHTFHGGECFCLIVGVLRGPGAPGVQPDDPTITVLNKGNLLVWVDHLTGYSIENGEDGFHFTVSKDGVVQLTAKLIDNGYSSEFVLVAMPARHRRQARNLLRQRELALLRRINCETITRS